MWGTRAWTGDLRSTRAFGRDMCVASESSCKDRLIADDWVCECPQGTKVFEDRCDILGEIFLESKGQRKDDELDDVNAGIMRAMPGS